MDDFSSDSLNRLEQALADARTEWKNLRAYASEFENDARVLRKQNDDLNSQIIRLEAEIERLTTELEECKKRIPPDPILPPSPDHPLPDVRIIIDGIDLKPVRPGDLWYRSGEHRWSWDVSNDVRVILDTIDDQRRIILQRAWGNLAIDAPVLTPRVTIILDGETVWDRPVRLHHHTRPCMTFRHRPLPLLPPKPEIFTITPMYDPASIPSPESIRAIVEGNGSWTWRRWDHPLVRSSGSFDAWSERYGFCINSWTSGQPLANEAAILPPWDIAVLMTRDPSLYHFVSDAWDSAGNYPIHFFSPSTGAIYLHNDPDFLSLPVLNADNLPSLQTAYGKTLPVPDIAHDFGLTIFPALMTGERFYIEELEAFTLLGPLCRRGSDRASGIYFSQQIRSLAWWLRNLFFLHLAYDPTSKRGIETKLQLESSIVWLNREFARPDSTSHRQTGILSTVPFRKNPWMDYAIPDTAKVSHTGNHHFLVHVLGMIHRSGIIGDLAEPILRHVLRVTRGVWENSPNKYLTPWLQHCEGSSWVEIMDKTFASLTQKEEDSLTFNTYPLTTDIFGWWRAAAIEGVYLGEQWAKDALYWSDIEMKKAGRYPSIPWRIVGPEGA